MKSLRAIFSAGILAALAIGYLASQFFALNGRAPEWAQTVDTPLVAWLALAVLLGAIALSFVPDRGEQD